MIEVSAFFLIGLTGGYGHCVLMCNPFVLYVSSKYAVHHAGYSMLIPHVYYNVGRSVTYAILGAIAGFFGSIVQYAGSSFVGIQKLAAIVGGVFLVVFALLSCFGASGSAYILSKLNISKLLKKINTTNPFFFGMVLGVLPCGLSMGAIIGATSSGSAIKGGLLLFAFGIGTSAAMMTMALFGNLAIKHSSILRKIGNVLLLITGIYFIYMGITFKIS